MPVHRPRAVVLALLVGVPIAAIVLGGLAPGTLDEKLTFLLRGVCAQRPSHSHFADGRPLALEARMYGIFVGFGVAVVVAWLSGRYRRSELPGGISSALFAACIGLMMLDGLNALLFDLRGPYAYLPTNELRLATGLLSGLGLAAFIAPVVSFVFFRVRDRRPLFASFRELLLSVVPVVLVGAVVVVGGAPGLFLSGAAALSVVGTFWLVNTYLCVLAWDGVGQAGSWGDVAPSALVGFVLTGGGLVGLSVLRGWLEATLGITWAV